MDRVFSPVLDALDPGRRSEMLGRAVRRRLSPGEVLHLEGEIGERIYLVAAGVVKLAARDVDGRETIVGLALPGDFAADLSVLERRPHAHDAIAASRSEVLAFEGRPFLEALEEHPAAALEFARGLSARLRWVVESARERTTSRVPARLAGRLLDLADLVGTHHGAEVDVMLPLAQADLARLAGMSRESACKTLRRFKRAGLIDYTRGCVRLLRRDELEAVRSTGRITPVERAEAPFR